MGGCLLIITIELDVTNVLPSDWKTMSISEIKEYFGDTPDCMFDGEFVLDEDGNIVHGVKKISEHIKWKFSFIASLLQPYSTFYLSFFLTSLWYFNMNKKPTPLTDKFLDDLKNEMDSLELKQTDLARFLGTSKQKVYSWFHHKRKPNGESILKIETWDKLK